MAAVKRIGPGSAFKIGLVLYAIVGLIIGLFAAFFSMVAGSIGLSRTPGAGALAMGFGMASIIIFPIMYGIIGGCVAAISAAIYNVVAGWVGGLEVDIS